IEVGGRLLFSSTDRVNLPPRERGIGYVPQEGALFPHFSVRRNILFGGVRGGFAKKAIRMEQVIEILEIGHLLERSVTKISGGEAQRVALARAILSRPNLLLLDEPLAALDIGLKERILPYLARVRDEFAIPMIYVTHNLTEVLTLADWVLMIREGRLVAQGVPKETLLSGPASREITEEHLENILPATFVDSDKRDGRSRVRLASGQEVFIPCMPQPQNSQIQIRVGADDIIIATRRPEGISAGNLLAGTVRTIEMNEGQALIGVEAGEDFCVRLTTAAVTRLALCVGTPVFLIIKTRSFRVL
ncbi:MAG TPA: ATP-binding cassette domain-containing protein, partial [Candidatus Binatia bacterium]|nr:ATP-binding cassette domain-containing protein [Candidatus Binatia bacterium]